MARTLLNFFHPFPARSRVGARLFASALQSVDVERRDLYELYPDFFIDVSAEQAALQRASHIVFLYPFFWYSFPSLLKEWLDQVLEEGFAYGQNGDALQGKSLQLCVSTGGEKTSYPGTKNPYSMDNLLSPLYQTAHICQMKLLKPFVIHGAHTISDAELIQRSHEFVQLLGSLDLQPEFIDGGRS